MASILTDLQQQIEAAKQSFGQQTATYTDLDLSSEVSVSRTA